MIQEQTRTPHTTKYPVPHQPDGVTPLGVRPEEFRPGVFDPFHTDPAEPMVTRQRVALIAAALLLGVGATVLALVLGSDRPTPGAFASVESDRAVTGLSTPSATVPPSAGAAAGAVASVAGTGSTGTGSGTGSTGKGSTGTGPTTGSTGTGSGDPAPGPSTDPQPDPAPEPDPDPEPEPDPEPIEATVEISSPAGGPHTAGTPLYLEATAQSPLSGNYLPGAVLHWTVKRGGTLVFSALGSSATVHGVQMTHGTYTVRVEVQAESFTGSDAVTVTVPFDLAPNPPDPTPTVTSPTDELAGP